MTTVRLGIRQEDSGPGVLTSSGYRTRPAPRTKSVSSRSLQLTAPRPPITRTNFIYEIRWFNLAVVTLTPLLSIYGLCTTKLHKATIAFSIVCYVVNMIGEYRSL